MIAFVVLEALRLSIVIPYSSSSSLSVDEKETEFLLPTTAQQRRRPPQATTFQMRQKEARTNRTRRHGNVDDNEDDDTVIPLASNTGKMKPPQQKSIKPPPWKNGGIIHHDMMQMPLLNQGYRPTGGKLPHDVAEFLMDPKMWKYVDNNTCITNDEGGNLKSSSSITANSTGLVGGLWQQRAPYALILGVMKGGTHALTKSLWEHPQIMPTGHWELHFYDNGGLAIRSDKGIYRHRSRENYAKLFLKSIPNFPTETNSKMMAIDASPRYILSSDRIPDAIFCITPWVKLLAIVRNPIDRAASQYRYLDETRKLYDKPMVDWETWIQDDIRLLKKAGVLNATSPKEEFEAWKLYQRSPNSNQIVGRGLYVIQIEQYFAAMDRHSKPRSDLLVIQSENFRNERQREYDKVLDFLHLPKRKLLNLTDEHITTNKHTSKPMPESIRIQLQDFYRPYNQRLYKLFGWDNAWD